MAGKIPVGINIVASETVTGVFEKIKRSMQKALGAVNEGPKVANQALETSAKAVERVRPIEINSKVPRRDQDWEEPKKNPWVISAESGVAGIERVTNTVKNLALLLVGSGGVTYGVKRFSDSVSDSVADINRIANRVGVSSKEIRELGFVARAAGVSTGTLGQAMTTLADVQFDKKSAIPSESVKALAALNSKISKPISLINSDGTRANLKKVLFEMTQALGEIHDPSLKARMASLLLGSEESLKFTDMGSERLKAISSQFQSAPFSKEVVDQAYHYNEAVAKIDAALDQLKFTAGADIMSGFSQGLDKSGALITQNREKIQKLASDFSQRLPKAIPMVFGALNGLGDALGWIDRTVGLTNAALTTFATFTGLKAVIMMADLTKAIGVLRATALGAAVVAAAPEIAVGAAVAAGVGAAGYGAYKLREAINNAQDTPGSVTHKLVEFGILTPKKEPASKVSNESLVKVVFENAPQGMRIVEKNSTSTDLSVELGLNLGGAF